MAVVTYVATSIVIAGPRNATLTYYWTVPSGSSVTDHAFFNALDIAPQQVCVLTVSAAPSLAGGGPVLTVYGSLDGPSVTPSGRNWDVIRGDASAANVVLNAVSAGLVRILTPVRSVRFRVSSGANATGVSSPINLRAMLYTFGALGGM